MDDKDVAAFFLTNPLVDEIRGKYNCTLEEAYCLQELSLLFWQSHIRLKSKKLAKQ